MSKVLILPLPEPGHILPTVRVSMHLRENGHEVTYLTAPSFKNIVSAADAHLAPLIAGDKGEQALSGPHIWSLFGGGDRIRVRFRRLSEMLRRILEQGQYNLLLLDRRLDACYRNEFLDRSRVLLFSTSLPDWNGPEPAHPDLPTLIFCPEQLEVPKFRHRQRHLHYVEPSLRPMDEADFLAEGIGDQPIVLAAFGTQSIKNRRLSKTNALIAAVARRMPRLQFVLVAPFRSGADTIRMPRNLMVVERIPQRQFLTRVSVFVLHGGLGSIKESITAGVPMIVLPALHDQPFNAMRVRFHGLGDALFPEKQNVEALEALVRDTLGGKFKDSLYRMQQHFLAMERASISHMLIDNHFANAGSDSRPDCGDAHPAATRQPNG